MPPCAICPKPHPVPDLAYHEGSVYLSVPFSPVQKEALCQWLSAAKRENEAGLGNLLQTFCTLCRRRGLYGEPVLFTGERDKDRKIWICADVVDSDEPDADLFILMFLIDWLATQEVCNLHDRIHLVLQARVVLGARCGISRWVLNEQPTAAQRFLRSIVEAQEYGRQVSDPVMQFHVESMMASVKVDRSRSTRSTENELLRLDMDVKLVDGKADGKALCVIRQFCVKSAVREQGIFKAVIRYLLAHYDCVVLAFGDPELSPCIQLAHCIYCVRSPWLQERLDVSGHWHKDADYYGYARKRVDVDAFLDFELF